ncbi:MAG TPA: manganese ABC transporter ATP-binding protein [Verrucomicrobiales bacterium]|jgi:manganese/zinc/iron transport system ATP- binding protein|nr:manganese ABC transporter ATP-binding protein [Verrucomicrobiales bacterium]HCQ80953.1 manganese ABC transporter ATP-binding protein [Verrucomicrobiales bacterium]|tara:strand:- start:15148 stop:15927 length:780 start_codon:yes stop_codon:yes gene_type:complete
MRPEHPPEFPLAVHDLTVAYHRKPVLWDVELNIPEGTLSGIVGPNGAGKSTLLKACLELIPKTSGEALIYGKSYETQRDLIAYVPQRESVDWDFPVSALDVVIMGTYRKLGWFKRVTKIQKQQALEALEKVGISHLAQRQISQLSGGQQQRVFLARALVQEAEIYFMDEPFAAVDAATEQAIIELLQELNTKGKTVLCVHHDLATVSRYFDYLVLLNMRVVASGPTSETFTRENLQKTYGGKLNLLDDVAQALKNVGRP